MTAGGIITALIIGLIIGALGRLVVPGRQNIPIWLTLVIGVVAALLGSAIARAGGFADTGGFVDWRELLLQIVLAAVGVLLTVSMYGRRRGRVSRY
ncbi:GlsB/YeaQ/YmgE family stress response membrane protein [Asanoa iriomotensis]|uniref:Transglycosylase n=1 Tax=Asanoa iriomotensis TaxID=234613 RepID=A0ABQ4BZR1_9ACTN|nr:GlsB/YeaQ/YmgE family stress response membrane protein [Asanoa iriomotensis]GIF56004.1 transglycosylase [Asanoa iriomotensis]